MNFIDFVAYVGSFVSISATLGVIMGSIIVSLDEKRKEKQTAQPLAQYCYAQKTDKQLERERVLRERAEHNARVLRQYKIKG